MLSGRTAVRLGPFLTPVKARCPWEQTGLDAQQLEKRMKMEERGQELCELVRQ